MPFFAAIKNPDWLSGRVVYPPRPFPPIAWGPDRAIGTEQPAGVAWSPDLNLFVLVTFGPTQNIYSSPDGAVWTLRQATGHGMHTVCWCPISQIFLAMSSFDAWTSPNGTAWTQHPFAAPPIAYLDCGEAVDGSLLLSRAGHFAKSIDGGATWVETAVAGNADWLGLSTKPATVTGSVGGNDVSTGAEHTLNSGSAWIASALPGSNGVTTYLYGASFNPEFDTFAAVGSDFTGPAVGMLWTSPDAITWLQRTVPGGDPLLKACCEVNRAPSPYIFSCGTANPTNKLLASWDGVTWIGDVGPAGDNFSSCAYNSIDNILVMTSFDGPIYAGTPA